MQTIEINTTQNVIINYELAQLKQRIAAFFLDFMMIWLAIGVLSFFTAIVSTSEMVTYVFYLIGLPLFFFYTLVMETLNNGQTMGKKFLNIKVVKIDGKEPQINDYLLRWVFRMVDIYFSIGALATLLIGSSNRNQRLGDLLANTTLIQERPGFNLDLYDILKINTLENYQPVYPEVKKLSEEDMLLTKAVLEMASRYNNKAHQEAIDMLTLKLKEKLSLTEIPVNKTLFLQTLIKDYVALTR
jgi:uncharacterized RDD family membrane protein YckC